MTVADPVRLPDAPLAVIGAGTMGAGIAQVAAAGGLAVQLYDAIDGAAWKAHEGVGAQLTRQADRGRMSKSDADAALALIEPVDSLEDLAGCFMAIEAAPELLDLKQKLFRELGELCPAQTVLASNTSSLPVTSIASGVTHPERVIGMHFFNPVPLMQLVEVVAGLASDEQSLAIARAVAVRMGKTAIDAKDVAGFLVNRVSRPFLLEAQRLLQEHVAAHDEIDSIMRLGGNFRMGPFELSDLVGVDVGLDVAKSFYEFSFNEPRWQPSPIAAQLVAGGRLGRKSGHGYYRYPDGGDYREHDPEPLLPENAQGAAVVMGDNTLADELRRLASAAGYELVREGALEPGAQRLIVDARSDGAGTRLKFSNAPVIALCAGGSLATIAEGRDMAGFFCLPPLAESHLVELTTAAGTSDTTAAAAAHFFHSIGKHTKWVGDAPGLVLGRIVCQLVNEAAFAVQEGVGTPVDIDRGVRLGLNYPRGLLEWGDAIGIDHVLATLDALQRETGSDRYRPAALLRRMVADGRTGRRSGMGFHDYGPQAEE